MCRREPRVDVAGVRRQRRAGGPGARVRHGGEQLPHGALQLALRPRIEAPAHGGRTPRVQTYFKLLPIPRPNGNSPFLMRVLKAQLGVGETPALLGVCAPSRPEV